MKAGMRGVGYTLNGGLPEGTKVLAHTQGDLAAVVRLCFGTRTIDRIQDVAATPTANGDIAVRFSYTVHLYGWAKPLAGMLGLTSLGGTATSLVTKMGATTGVTLMYFASPIKTSNRNVILYPPDGLDWYPKGYPDNIRRAYPKTVTV